MQTAHQLRMRSLFHYERFKPEYFVPSLARSTIFMNRPGAFNDPWDCKPSFNTDSLDDASFRERQVQYFDRSSRRQTPHALTEAERTERTDRLRSDPAQLRAYIDQVSRDAEGAIDGRYRVYCLSTKPANLLMWGHYADGHKGICLEFGTNNEVFCAALKVEYSQDYPPYDLADEDDETILTALTTKSEEWRYEEEFRLMAQERGAAVGGGTLLTDDGILEIPKTALKAVIIGCQMPIEHQVLVREAVAKHRPGVPLLRAVRVPNRFELRIEPLP